VESSPNNPQALVIHILNAGWGESIVLQLPDGHWGVIDCNSSSSDAESNQTIIFLKQKGVKNLAFVCLTHPHADHFSGMYQLFSEFKVESFWCFHLARPGQMGRLCRVLDYEATRAAPGHNRVSHFTRLLDIVQDQRRTGTLVQKLVQASMDVYPPNISVSGQVPAESVHIRAIAPTDETIQNYFGKMDQCFDSEGKLTTGRPPTLNHNEMSIVFWLTYGKSRVALCADLEANQWIALFKQHTRGNAAPFAASAVKVSHHGSVNSRCEGLWPAFAAIAPPVSVVTPSETHGLPDAEALSEISEHSAETWICSSPATAGVLTLADMVAEFGAVTGSQLFESIQGLAKLNPSRHGCCSITLSYDGTVASHGSGAAFRLANPSQAVTQ
jgi:beta-lactamase superfamily II metal-dependent hydrolase